VIFEKFYSFGSFMNVAYSVDMEYFLPHNFENLPSCFTLLTQ
jgi:hypothetical protein